MLFSCWVRSCAPKSKTSEHQHHFAVNIFVNSYCHGCQLSISIVTVCEINQMGDR